MSQTFQFKIWGSRGSIGKSKGNSSKFGLNTTCISLETDDEFIVIDAGSGIIDLDEYIYNNNLTSKKITILLTHYHYDHILGLPFTKMFYDKNICVEIFGAKTNNQDCYEILANIFGSPYFPVSFKDMGHLKVYNIDNNICDKVKDVRVDMVDLNHKDGCKGYKLSFLNKAISIITDYEYFSDKNSALVEKFIEKSDYLIMDTFFANDDFIAGWGHSTVDECIMLVNKLNIGNGLLTHHNPKYDDDFLENLESNLKEKYVNILVARDGMFFDFTS